MKSRAAVRVAALAAIVLVSGCADSPRPIATAPETLERPAVDPATDAGGDALIGVIRGERGGPPTFEYPLTIGHSAEYTTTYQMGFDEDPSDEPAFGSSTTRTITCETTHDGKRYFVEQWTEGPPGPWFLMRQDRTGLYEVDPIRGDSPCGAGEPAANERVAEEPRWSRWISERGARLAADPGARVNPEAFERAWKKHAEKIAWTMSAIERGGEVARPPSLPPPPAGELRRLAYPLTPGRAWVIRTEPRFGSRVEAIETITLPSGRHRAARIRMTSEIYGPDDRVHVWYGPDGFLRLKSRYRTDVTDGNGNPIGVISGLIEERMVRLVRP